MSQSLDALKETMAGQSLAPLWEIYQTIVTREPVASEPSRIWHWRALLPTIEAAAASVKGELADHRVLLLQNPAFNGRASTTTNLIAGIQCVLPGEKTVEHRHSASACRLILEGRGGATFVDGKRCLMHDNDFIITPNWTWHGHDNDSGARAVWLDMLDLPLLQGLDANFGGRGPANEYPQHLGGLADAAFGAGLVPASGRPATPYSPRFRWAWDEVRHALDAAAPEPDGTRRLRYANPLDGGAIMPTLEAQVIDLPQGRPVGPMRSTANAIAVVLEGEGASRVGEIEHRWERRDIFTLPHWQWVTHTAASAPARLLVVSDREVLRKLGLLREERAS